MDVGLAAATRQHLALQRHGVQQVVDAQRSRLNLRAQNLGMFIQIAQGVDDETWLHHLRRGDYSRWFSAAIKDPVLEAAARRAEALGDTPVAESRRLIRDAIEQRYTAPA